MNHSSILQIHLNGGENSLSGEKHSIRIFSSASPSSSAPSSRLLSEGCLIKKRNQGSGNRCVIWKGVCNLQVNWKDSSEKRDWFRSFKGFASWGQMKKSRGKEKWSPYSSMYRYVMKPPQNGGTVWCSFSFSKIIGYILYTLSKGDLL